MIEHTADTVLGIIVVLMFLGLFYLVLNKFTGS